MAYSKALVLAADLLRCFELAPSTEPNEPRETRDCFFRRSTSTSESEILMYEAKASDLVLIGSVDVWTWALIASGVSFGKRSLYWCRTIDRIDDARSRNQIS